ncbi:metallophosphoesterase [Manganibacter manganicus]|nr:metallophosphoesterase [Pseudaminobacter manganicus]
MKSVKRLFGLDKRRAPHPRLQLDLTETVVYAIGDVHGCLAELLALERIVVEDARTLPGRKLIVMLGDYVDRGPSSAQVLDHLIAPAPDGFERICLTGNHELAMCDYLEGGIGLKAWLAMGAGPTLRSYGLDLDRLAEIYRSEQAVEKAIRETIPAAHLDFLRALPILVESRNYIFVHAGVRPGIAMDKQVDDDLVLIRSAFFDNADLLTRYVVHGHTPVDEASRIGMHVSLDTGAYFSGRLTALRIWRNKGRYLTNR